MEMDTITCKGVLINMMQMCEITVKENPNLRFTVCGDICFRAVHEGNEVAD